MSKTKTAVPANKEIIIAPEGWVFIGEVTKEGTDLVVTNASCIRRWGTTAGLGEIAVKGVTPDTVLDFVGDIRIPREARPLRIKCMV